MVASFTVNKTVNIDSILVKGYNRNATGDTLLFNKVPTLVKTVGLPLSLTADSTGFVVFANGKSATLWIKHTMNLQLISQSCGFAPNYVLTATRHSSLIDSIKVSDQMIGPKTVEKYATLGQNITVYLHLTTP
jgi:hypothetical protein